MLLQNIKSSVKRLYNNKLYTIINIGGLSLSFAIAILILLYVHNELNVDKHHTNLDNLYRLVDKDGNYTNTNAKFGEYIKNKYPEVESFSRYFEVEGIFQFNDNKTIKIKNFAFLDSSSLDMFSINIIKKNTNQLLHTDQSILLSQNTARKYFGDTDPIGKTIKLDNYYDYIVEGIFEDYPTNSSFKHDVIANFPSVKFGWGYPKFNVLEIEEIWAFTTFVMLKENVNKKEFNERLKKDITERFERPSEFYLQEFSDIYFNNDIPDDGVKHGKKQIVNLFLGLALIIIVIAMINYINLSTSMSSKRALSIGIYKTLGAQRINLIIQFIVETLIICIIALILGYILAELFIPAFNNLVQYNLQVKTFYLYPFNLISIVVSIIIGLISGIYPAFFLTKFSPIRALKNKISKSKGIELFKKGLIIFQFIITISLITGTIVVYKQLDFWRNMDIGINKDNILILELIGRSDNAKLCQKEINKIANIENTCFASAGNFRDRLNEEIDGQEISMSYLSVDEDYFDLYNIQVIDGEGFSKDNPEINKRKYLLNEAAVKYLNWENAYEKDIGGMKCIGVIKDFNFASPHDAIAPLFISYGERSLMLSIKISSKNIPSTLKQIEETWKEIYPQFPFEYRFVDDIFDEHFKNEERLSEVLGYFAAFSIFIACLGLFGLISFMAEQRTKEIGVRKANGANIRNIILLFSKEFIQLILISGIIAVPLSYYILSKWLQNFAYATKLSWWVFAVSIVIAIVISSLSVFYRAYRAASQNPVNALRYE
ncbi:MAG: FtsX-like permease family protein [Bacteroidales bacterium]|nr:FtsX-like permease family protein [Bacteroidales bacterium]